MTATASRPKGAKSTKPAAPATTLTVEEIDLKQIVLASNVRDSVGDVAELADSIREHGLLEPVKVVRLSDGTYRLRFGHRRVAAAAVAGLERIPAVVSDGPDPDEVRAIEQLVENLQREDLTPVEEAKAYRAILDANPKMTQAELAKRVGKAPSTIANALRILDLSPKVLKRVESGELSGAHAKALASLKGKAQAEHAEHAADYGWSAKELEQRVAAFHAAAEREAAEVRALEGWAKEVEAELVAKGADKAKTVLTTPDGYYYGTQRELAALKARGWTVRGDSWGRGKPCDCDAWGIGRTYDGETRVVRRCVSKAHYDAKREAEGSGQTDRWERQEAARKLAEAQRRAIHDRIGPELSLAFRKLPPNIGRILLWVVMDWSLNDWVKEHKGDRKRPDAWGELAELSGTELADELRTYVLRGFQERYNIRLDWPAIAEAFNVDLREAGAAEAEEVAS